MVEDDDFNPRKKVAAVAQRILPRSRADEQGHDTRVVVEASAVKPSKIMTKNPPIASDDGMEEDNGQAETDSEPSEEDEEGEEDEDEYSKDELGQEELPQAAAQLGGFNSPGTVVLDALSPQDMDPAPLRSLKSIAEKYHENKSTQPSSCDVSGIHNPVLTASQPNVRSLSGVNNLYSSTARPAKRTALDAGSLTQSFDPKRQRITQKVADELQNSVEYRLRPSQIQKDWEGVFKLLQDAVVFCFNDAKANTRQHVSLVPRTELDSCLKGLYQGVLGNDMWRVSAMHNAGLLTAYHS